MELKGCDISHHQDSISTGMLAENEFFICKASEGVSFNDSKFHSFVATLKANNKLIGAYHFARPENNKAVDEAVHFVNVVKPYIDQVVLALDWEMTAWQYPIQWALDWLNKVYELTGVRPVIYCHTNKRKYCDIIAKANFGLWVVYWSKNDGTKPVPEPESAPWVNKAFWQYTSKPYDKDIFFGTREQFMKYAKSDKDKVAEEEEPKNNDADGTGEHFSGCEFCEDLENFLEEHGWKKDKTN